MKRLAQFSDMSAMPTAGGETPVAPQSTFKIIYSPLDSIGKILADLDFKTFLQNNFDLDSSEIALKIWTMYGGSENDMEEGKKGKRQISPASSDMTKQSEIQEKEYNDTRNSKWERLPEGVSIDEITTTTAIEKAVTGGMAQLAKQYAKPATASIKQMIKVAELADQKQDYRIADKIQDLMIIHVYSTD